MYMTQLFYEDIKDSSLNKSILFINIFTKLASTHQKSPKMEVSKE